MFALKTFFQQRAQAVSILSFPFHCWRIPYCLLLPIQAHPGHKIGIVFRDPSVKQEGHSDLEEGRILQKG